MHYLVTGGAGFIGAHIARRLLSEGHTVVVVDNLCTGARDNIPAGAEFIPVDIGTPGALDQMPAGPVDAVFHLAAQSSGEISFERPEYDILTNALGTLNMLRWCAQSGTARFLYASSMAAYGPVGDAPAVETHCPQPQSFYGITKLAGEHYVRAFGRDGLHTTVFRMFNVYGPGQNLSNRKQGMVSIYLSFILRGETLLVKGDKNRFRDFIYIDDVVDAWMAALHRPAAVGRLYNLASGTKTHVHELVDALIRAFGYTRYPVKYAGSTPGDLFGMWADIGRIKAELGWPPQTTLADGLAQMVAWARAHPISSTDDEARL